MLNRDKILNYLKDEGKPVYETQIFSDLNISSQTTPLFYQLIDTLEYTGQIIKTKKNKYALPEKMGLTLGKMISTPKGFGFVREIKSNNKENDIFIPANQMKTAMEGDLVYCKVLEKAKANNKREGQVVKIIKRNNTTIVGTFQKNRNFGFLIPDNPAIFNDIFIKKSDFGRAKNKDKVVVKIKKWGFGRSLAEGKIIEVIGDIKQDGVDILSIIRKYKLKETFSKKILQDAEKASKQITNKDIKNRLDYRNKNVITIDGIDTKDMDDAISLETDKKGNYILGVHIADVTHYVKLKTKLDKEAALRGNSVYLIDTVLPMLPKTLSNGICSLNPHQDRLTLSVFIIFDKQAKVLDYQIKETIINSKYRLNYKEVSKILDKGKISTDSYIDPKTQKMLIQMHILAQKLRTERDKKGALDFNFKEAYIVLDKKGKPIDIKPRERGSANKLIEEFMIKANQVVAEYAVNNKLPFVYRIHEQPDMERLSALNSYIKHLSYQLNLTDNKVKVKELQNLLNNLKGTNEERTVAKMLLRSLKQARYSPNCLGHLGLATDYYCHFTSPIRRYADLQIHRILKLHINGNLKNELQAVLNHTIEVVSETTSLTERVAEKAEREVIKMKMSQYMADRTGEQFDAIISSINKFGIYSELDNTIEGFTKISHLEDDYYIYNETNLSFVGDRTKKVYKIGDRVKIKVAKVDVEKRQIDFKIL